jgi:oxygen-independent coproporphyrinogen-3 oxidase
MVLQLKTGALRRGYFQKKFGVDITAEFADEYRTLEDEGWLRVTNDGVELTPAGFLQVDRHLPTFFDPQYRGPRYT